MPPCATPTLRLAPCATRTSPLPLRTLHTSPSTHTSHPVPQFDGLVEGYAARMRSESNAPGGLHLEPIDRLDFLLLNSFGACLELGKG